MSFLRILVIDRQVDAQAAVQHLKIQPEFFFRDTDRPQVRIGDQALGSHIGDGLPADRITLQPIGERILIRLGAIGRNPRRKPSAYLS